MKNITKLFFMAAIASLTVVSCSDDDEDDAPAAAPAAPAPVINGTNPAGYTSLGTDVSGDANGGLDVINTEYRYDDSLDILMFRVTTNNLASYSSNPSVDFNFVLPNGTSNNDALGTPFSGTIMTHKNIHLYTDDGGTPPSNYTYTNSAGFAVNGVNLTKDTQTAQSGSDLDGICSDCVDITVDVASNTIITSVDRKQIITDAEVGSTKSAKIRMSSGVGQARSGSDTGTDGVEFTIFIK
jgi:hypothetical protein